MDRLVERLRRRRRATAAGGDRDRGTAPGEGEHGDDEHEQAAGGESAEIAHGDPFSGSSPSVLAGVSERSLRRGSSIVKRGALDERTAAVAFGRRAHDRKPEPGARAGIRRRARTVRTPARPRRPAGRRPRPTRSASRSRRAPRRRRVIVPRPWRRAFSTRFATARSSAARSPRTSTGPTRRHAGLTGVARQLVERDDVVGRPAQLPHARARAGRRRALRCAACPPRARRRARRSRRAWPGSRRCRRAPSAGCAARGKRPRESDALHRASARARSTSRSASRASRPISSSFSACGRRRRGSLVRSISAAARASLPSGRSARRINNASAAAPAAAATRAASRTSRRTLASVESTSCVEAATATAPPAAGPARLGQRCDVDTEVLVAERRRAHTARRPSR